MIDASILRQIPLFSKLRDEQLKFTKLGRGRWVESGEILAIEGEPAASFCVLIEGQIKSTKKVGDRQIPWANFGPHAYFGHELILLNQPCLATTRTTLKSYLLEFDTQAFWKMMELCPSISRELLIDTAQRTQALGMVSMQTEKLRSLGTLTSGLSQELRHVAADGRQAVEHLQDLFQWLQPLTVKLNAQRMASEQHEFMLNLQQTILERVAIFPLKSNPQAWRVQEEKIIQWLTERSIPHQQHFAKVLTQAGLDTAVLNDIANVIPPESVCAVLAWLKTTLKSLALANEVRISTQHIAGLVQSAKDYTYLDQAPLQEMDVHEGLERTLTVLNHRLEPGIEVIREYDRTLPAICIYGSDMNQVWTHLIDNAIDAMAGLGQLTLRTAQAGERVLVEITDNGPGIPSEVQPHIFDQFFTTKAKDNGTGLRLPIAYRVVVDQHQGQIQVCSKPGCTCFQVYLPMDLTESSYIPAKSRFAQIVTAMPISLKSVRLNTALLRRVPVLAGLPEVKLQWLIDQGQEIRLQPSELLRAEGTPATCVFVLLEGNFRMTQRVGNQDILLQQHNTPTLFGAVPLLMGVSHFWASGRGTTACHILELSADTFWQLMGWCPTLAMTVLRTMVERVQEAQVLAQHRERLISLGTLAAGLAHELNNPAAAARRAADELQEIFPILQTQTLKLAHKSLTDNQSKFFTSLQQDAIARAQRAPVLDALTQSDHEDRILEWMDDHNIQNGWQLASTLFNAGIDSDWLDRISEPTQQYLHEILLWLDATLTVVGLLHTLEHSTGRIHGLVEAVQNYSSLDAADLQAVDIHEGLESTLMILGHKLKQGVIVRDYTDKLPAVMSSGHELEQVWVNMIDNAIDAVIACSKDPSGVQSQVVLHASPLVIPRGWQSTVEHSFPVKQQPTIWIRTRCEADWVLVEIADNGIGIPPEVQPHIFEPFFTTKGVGQGTGLGLNTSYKIVERHGGDIRVKSQPGDTCFQVRLPGKGCVAKTGWGLVDILIEDRLKPN